MSQAVTVENLELTRGGKNCLSIPLLTVDKGERIQITGLNGSGKTSLLQLLTGLLTPDSGHIEIFGQPIGRLSGSERETFRAGQVGYIFQQPTLIPYLNPLENILLPCRLSKGRQQRLEDRKTTANYEAYRLMAALNMENPELLRQNTGMLSIGQQQRVAIARALIGSPPLILADEAASALDPPTRQTLYDMLLKTTREHEQTLICIDHTPYPGFDRCLDMSAINHSQQVARLW
ncbi:ATP-binding cassette domain-containing protein [Endozoicomonas sp. SCSIO W0465]|uniref:ATP-binding cassette domain-containing protein n=1 Tax=Endozoicomonas sp. SCSIO W0465 TaxID=2918516 RepID=UPI0020764A78|nr:ATP-binding cassette domain-containing protein [Endozoicomonas sp. SCSIO W0465]USE37852.1 ATP-binding cassette domain-containing protein [Endozoicomonas sp. SCSIO W0465]